MYNSKKELIEIMGDNNVSLIVTNVSLWCRMLMVGQAVWADVHGTGVFVSQNKGFQSRQYRVVQLLRMSPMILLYYVFLLHNFLSSFSQYGCTPPSIVHAFQT